VFYPEGSTQDTKVEANNPPCIVMLLAMEEIKARIIATLEMFDFTRDQLGRIEEILNE